jgi:predicted nucleic acid-binding Zn ribbon protein
VSWEPLPEQVDHTHELSDVLGTLHRRLGLARPDVLSTLDRHWASLLGAELAAHCTLESVRQGRLVIVADDPAIAEHLRWSSQDLLGAANSVCGGAAFDELTVKVAR